MCSWTLYFLYQHLSIHFVPVNPTGLATGSFIATAVSINQRRLPKEEIGPNCIHMLLGWLKCHTSAVQLRPCISCKPSNLLLFMVHSYAIRPARFYTLHEPSSTIPFRTCETGRYNQRECTFLLCKSPSILWERWKTNDNCFKCQCCRRYVHIKSNVQSSIVWEASYE